MSVTLPPPAPALQRLIKSPEVGAATLIGQRLLYFTSFIAPRFKAPKPQNLIPKPLNYDTPQPPTSSKSRLYDTLFTIPSLRNPLCDTLFATPSLRRFNLRFGTNLPCLDRLATHLPHLSSTYVYGHWAYWALKIPGNTTSLGNG